MDQSSTGNTMQYNTSATAADPYAGYNYATGQYDYSSYYTSGYAGAYGYGYNYGGYGGYGYDTQSQAAGDTTGYDASAYGTPPAPIGTGKPAESTKPKKIKAPKPPGLGKVTSEEDSYCDVCSLQCPSVSAYNNHCRGMMHSQKVMEKDKDNFILPDIPPEEVTMDIVPDSYSSNPSFHTNITPGLGGMMNQADPNEQFYCDICECAMTGPRNFEDHKKGGRHKKNVEHRAQGEAISKSKGRGKTSLADIDQFGEVLDVTPRIQEAIDAIQEPLLGLQFITEFQRPDPTKEARYVCNMCESKCDPRTLIPHLIGTKHRLKYLEEKYMHYHTIIKQKGTKRSEIAPVIDDYARTVETEEGRRPIVVRVEMDPPPEPVPKAKKPKLNPNTVNYEYSGMPTHLAARGGMGASRGRGAPSGRGKGVGGPVSGYGGYTPYDSSGSGFVSNSMYPGNSFNNEFSNPMGGQARSGGFVGSSFVSNKNATSASSAMADLLANMSECLVTSEEEAEMALQVSNALTQALLKFRMKDKN